MTMQAHTLIFTLLLSALGAINIAVADDHGKTAMDNVQPEDVMVEEESVEIPLNRKDYREQTTQPKRGMSQKAVKQAFGEPKKVVGPTGKPPITRWVYDEFTVYFESSWVIHTVRNP